MTTASPSAPPTEFPLHTRTAPALWRYALDQGWTTPAYFEEREDGWRAVSWPEAGVRVEALKSALLARGVRRGDVVAVLSRTRLEWILLDWAIMSVGAVVVGLYPTNTAGECAYVLGHSEAVLAFAEDDAQREKLGSVRVELPALREIVGFDELPALEAQGRSYPELEPDEVREDDLATLIYTSGTTGPPKGCMLTHKNLMTAALRVKTHIEGQTDTVLLFLPLAHSFARIVHHSAASRGAALALVADAARVPEAIERWIRFYESERAEGEEFNAFVDRVGTEQFESCVKDLTMPIEFSLENMSYFIDWSKSAPFEVIRGEGECAV